MTGQARARQGWHGARHKLLIVAGPTASGKSALALALARRLGGTIINADAMQCYRELRVLTARPSPEDEALAPHRLYGVRAGGRAGQCRLVAGGGAGRDGAMRTLPILCGGTGMYFSALMHGIADIPDPGERRPRGGARACWRNSGPRSAACAGWTPETAAKLNPDDSQRVARAYEVLRGTGRGLASWQAQPTERLTGWRIAA